MFPILANCAIRRVAMLVLACWAVSVSACASWPRTPLGRFEQQMVFPGAQLTETDWPSAEDRDEIWFTSGDGTRLYGWYFAHPQPRATVLCLHGNGGNIRGMADSARSVKQQLGMSVMVFDYRGYGRSEGEPDEAGVLADARAARAWLANRADIAEQDVVLWGHSLGGGVAVDLAAADGARGLILESTFTSVPDVAQSHVRWLPARLLMHNRFDSLSKIANYHGPLLVSHGTADRVIPFAQGEKLFAAGNEPKRFVRVEGGRHNDGAVPELIEAVDQFLGQLPPVSQPGARSQ